MKAPPTLRARRGISVVTVVGVMGIVISFVGFWLANRATSQTRNRHLDSISEQARASVQRRMDANVEAVFGLRGLFLSHDTVDGSKFADYVASSDLFRRSRGSSALSFDRRVPFAQIAAFEGAVRAAAPPGSPRASYRVQPLPSPGADAVVVDLIEPRAGNEDALGFNVADDPVRAEAIAAARDTGGAVCTAPVELVQRESTVGVLVFLAVYRGNSVPVTAPARRRNFEGVVAAVIDVNVLLRDVLGLEPTVRVAIYDVGPIVADVPAVPTAGRRLFASDTAAENLRSAPRVLDLNVADRRWRLLVAPRQGFESVSERIVPFAVALAGLVVTALGMALANTTVRARRMAEALAADTGASLRARESDLRRTVAELQKANEQLRDLDRRKDTFLGTVSHELSTPLTSIKGFAALMSRGDLTEAQRADFLQRIARNAESLHGVVEQLLEFSQLQRGSMRLNLEELDLSVLVTDILRQSAIVLADHELISEITDGLRIRGDRLALTRVLSNLLTNATKYSPKGTRVWVTLWEDSAQALLGVRDDGPGIPEDEREHIFDAFYRGRDTERTREPGTGVGLALVKEITGSHGGTVRMQAPAAGGAEFIVALPLLDGTPD